MNTLKATQKGFSLIELMIVVTIMGILASVVIPAYNDYVKKGKAAEATATLADLRIKMEQRFQDERKYTGGACAPTTGAVFFTYTCSVAASEFAYTLKATGNSSKDMGGFEFTVDQDNVKYSKYDGTTGASCWLTSKSGSCS